MEHLAYRRKITVMLAIMAGMLFASMNMTIVGTALPRIVAVLGGTEYYSWVFTAYMLSSSVTSILVGKLSDMYGRKPFLLGGLGVFVVGSLLSGTSSDIIQLIIYRAVQGLGGGMIISTSFTAIGDLFSPRERAKWQGMMGAVFGLSSVIGPTMGGYIVDHMEWHWVFWIFMPFGLVAFALIMWLFPKAEERDAGRIDYLGSLFLVLTMVPMLLAFSWAGTRYDWDSPTILGLFAASAVSLVIFLLLERRADNPILPLFLFKSSIFNVSNLAGFLLGAGMFGAIMYMPYFVQGAMGRSATVSSYISMGLTLSLVLGNAVSGLLISRTGKYKILALGGLALMAAGMYLMSFMHTGTTVPEAIINMVIVGTGLGLSMPVFTLTVQNAVEQRHLGVATASTQLFRSLGGTIGVSVMGTVLAQRMTERVSELMRGAQPSTMDPGTAAKLGQLLNVQTLMDPERLDEIRHSLPVEMLPLLDKIIAMLRDALSYSLSGVFLTGAIVMVAALFITLFLEEIPLRTGRRKMAPAADPSELEGQAALMGDQPAPYSAGTDTGMEDDRNPDAGRGPRMREKGEA